MSFASCIVLFFFTCAIDQSRSETPTSPRLIVGNENLTHQYRPIGASISKLRIDGPFYCSITWNNHQQYIDVFTDTNLHSYIKMEIRNQTLAMSLPSMIDFKFTQMQLNLYLHPTVQVIHLAGLAHLRSANLLSGKRRFKIDSEGHELLLH